MARVRKWWRSSDRMGRWLFLLLGVTGSVNIAFFIWGQHQWWSLIIGVGVVVTAYWHLIWGTRRREYKEFIEFEERRKNWRWN